MFKTFVSLLSGQASYIFLISETNNELPLITHLCTIII